MLCTFPLAYIFWPGNIYRSIYSNERGFWLVGKGPLKSRTMRRCDEQGNLVTAQTRLYGTSEVLTMPVPGYASGFLWRDLNAGRYPELDAHNEAERVKYLDKPDSYWAPILQKNDEEAAARRAEYEALPDIEKRLRNWDWTYRESDDSSASRNAAAGAHRIFQILDTMPEAEARALVAKHAYHGETYDSMKQLVRFHAPELNL